MLSGLGDGIAMDLFSGERRTDTRKKYKVTKSRFQLSRR